MAEKTPLNNASTHWIKGTIEDVSIIPSSDVLSVKIKGADAHISKDGKYNIYMPFEQSETDKPCLLEAENRIQVAADQTPGLLDFIRDALFNKKTVKLEVEIADDEIKSVKAMTIMA